MCVSIFSTSFVRNISHSKKNWTRYDKKTYIGLHVSTGYCCQILIKYVFSGHFLKNSHVSNFMKIRAKITEFFSMQTDGQTDMTKLTVAVRNFANAPKNPRSDILNDDDTTSLHGRRVPLERNAGV